MALIFLKMARLRLPFDMHFTQKTYYFLKNCHVAVSVSKVTNGPSKCSQEKGLLPYYHNLFVMFVIFENKWR